jgi:tripartite-type tricarboxylate transporter receptor subunit TctC
MMRAKKRLAAFGLALALAILPALSATAQDNFPKKPIRMFVPFSPGSTTDLVGRVIGQKMAEHWGQPVVVENRPSAGGIVASSVVAGAAPDGYTLLFHGGAFAVSASLYPKLPYDTLRDFAGISQASSTPHVVVVAPSLKIRSIKELIALARQKPGRITFGSGGIGSANHMSGELFKSVAGIDVIHVPYKGPPEALTDTLTGRIHYSMSGMAPALPYIKDGRLLALAMTAPQRSPTLPDVPTVAESGFPGFEYDGWLGLWAPARTPKPILNQLSNEVRRIVDLPDFRERLRNQGMTPRSSTPEEFDKFVHAEVEKMARLVKSSGARAE